MNAEGRLDGTPDMLPAMGSGAVAGLLPDEADPFTAETNWAAFFGIDSSLVRIESLRGGICIRAISDGEDNKLLEDALHQLLDLTPHGWNWSLDMDAIRRFNLHVLDVLLTIGRHLDDRGGTLTITGLHLSDDVAYFSDLFRQRCADLHIILDENDTGTDCPRGPECIEEQQGKAVRT